MAGNMAQEPTASQSGSQTGLLPVNAPTFYVTTVNAALTSNDAALLFATARPTISSETNAPGGMSVLIPTVLVHMSLHTLKDLSKILSDIVSKYEEEHGTLFTDFTS